MYEFIIFCVVFAVAIGGLIVMKKISPEIFWAYLVWVLFILAIAAARFQPWRVFI